MPPKSKWGSKEFPFKGFIKCYSCGSSLVGEQKLRQRQDGTVREHIYYHCSRQVDRYCKELFATEESIVDQLYEMRNLLIPNLEIVEPGLKNAISKTAAISNLSTTDAFEGYMKYVLYRGTKFEKAQLVRNISLGLSLHNRKITVNEVLNSRDS